jgi:hypothetical protein
MKPILTVLTLSALPLLGCGATFATLDYSTVSPQVVEVAVDSTGMGKFSLRVKNLSGQPLTIHRDQVVLRTVKGDRVPLAQQNTGDTEVVEPGATKPIIVRYSTQDLPDDTLVSLRFDKALPKATPSRPRPRQ